MLTESTESKAISNDKSRHIYTSSSFKICPNNQLEWQENVVDYETSTKCLIDVMAKSGLQFNCVVWLKFKWQMSTFIIINGLISVRAAMDIQISAVSLAQQKYAAKCMSAIKCVRLKFVHELWMELKWVDERMVQLINYDWLKNDMQSWMQLTWSGS